MEGLQRALDARHRRTSPWGTATRAGLIMLVGLGLVPLHASPAGAQAVCMACHGSRDLLGRAVSDSAAVARLLIDATGFAGSIHGAVGFRCTTCHRDIEGFPHAAPAPVNCGGCHGQARDRLAGSVHGQPHPESGQVPVTCADCHSSHGIRPPSDVRSTVYRMTQYKACATCHSDAERMRQFGEHGATSVPTYLNSVHGHALLDKGLAVAPLCTDCHGRRGTGAHEITALADSTSPVHRNHVGETCGRCHVGILAQYDRGIHGQVFAAGDHEAPTCIDCHAEHGILSTKSPGSHVYPTHVAQTCTACHDREDFNAKYGLSLARGRTFLGSFHGVALASGQLTVANCESCHGAHEILPSSDPRSSIHASNLVATCGSCHPGIGAGVAKGKVHITSVRDDVNLLAFGVQWFYYVLIAGVVAFAAVMIALDQYRWRVVRRRGGVAHG